MSDFIKFTGRTGAAYVRRDDVLSIGATPEGHTTILLSGGREIRDVTDPLPVIEAALCYSNHPAVADLARHKLHLDNIRCDLANAGIAIPADDDPELTPRRTVKALIAEVTRLRANLAAVRDAERNTMARLREICAERDGLIRKLDAVQEEASAPTTPKPGDVVTVEIARALPVGAVVEWEVCGNRTRATKTGGNKWTAHYSSGDSPGWGDAWVGAETTPAHLVSLPTPETPAETPAPTFTPAKVGDRWGDLSEEQIKALPEGTRMENGCGRKTLTNGSWFYDETGAWAGDNIKRHPGEDNLITHIPTPTRAPCDGDRLDSFTAEELEGLPVGARFVHPDGFTPAMVKKSDGWHKAGRKLDRPLDIGPGSGGHQDHSCRTLILPSPE